MAESWEPQPGPGFATVEVDRRKMTADITRIQFDQDFSPSLMMSFTPGMGGFGAVFTGWLEKEAEFSKRFPMLKPGDARVAEINSVTVSAKMPFEQVVRVLKACVRPIRMLFWTNIRPHLTALDHVVGEIGYALQHTFRGLRADMDAVQAQEEAELRVWFKQAAGAAPPREEGSRGAGAVHQYSRY